MSLEEVRKVYERWGREDPLYAVLTCKGREGNRWDPAEFFATGQAEIHGVLAYADSMGAPLARGRALDFGCGVGRLSQALADHFQEVVGVDIASTMVDRARTFNRHGARVDYRVNTAPDLRLLDDATFDLVYSSITLQHVPPENQARYITEFLRVLRPGGLAIFQVQNGPWIRPGSLRERLYTLRRRHLRRLWRRVRGKPQYEMHAIARRQVEQAVREGGGQILDVVDLREERSGTRLRYCAARGGPARAGAGAAQR
jgi:ubiquinone/menaquinone biosynthesis C-methylase UbiE